MVIFTEAEYQILASGLGARFRMGGIERPEYCALLKKLSEHREIQKPEVRIRDVTFEEYGGSEIAHGFALNHPRLGKTHVRTSLVVLKAEDGSFFETLNTRYVVVNERTGDTDPEEDRARSKEL